MNEMPHVFLIDNFDSFSFNLAYEFRMAGCEVEVWRNTISVEKALERLGEISKPLIVLSPGPGTPAEAGCCIELIRKSNGRYPIFGVCLGHQAIVEAFGGTVDSANIIVHGKTSELDHDGKGLFAKVPNPMIIARYHSLIAARLPQELRATARTAGLVMAVEHTHLPIRGVQFHPESVLTTYGSLLIGNIVKWAEAL